jgi:hypothetical protein
MKKRFKDSKYDIRLRLALNNPNRNDRECIKTMVKDIRDGYEAIDQIGSGFWSNAYEKIACNYRMVFSHNLIYDIIILIHLTKLP